MDHRSFVSMVDPNASIVAASNDETLFLSSTGDVLVCRDFACPDDRSAKSEIPTNEDNMRRLRGELNDCNLAKGRSKSPFLLEDTNDKIARNLWGEHYHQQDDEVTCCDVNASCHSNGLCGGAESTTNNSYGNSMDTNTKQKRGKSSHIQASASAPNRYNKDARERGVAYVNSSDISGRKGLSINTSRSIDDEEYDDVDMNGVTLGDHDQWLTVGTSSPTPVMSFDYSCYEPPTPEASRSYEFEEDKHFSANRMEMIGRGTKHVSMPNLSEESESQLKDTINLPTGSIVPLNKQSLQPHTIPPRTQLNEMRDKLSNVGAIEKSGMIPGIPTFLSHLSQIKITRLSAHPRGHHVLLVSDEGMLFSFGSNDRGQLGLGKQHFKVTAPQLITPLLENGGKTVQCAAGLDYSLVVVRTEGSRIAHRRRQQQRNQTTAVLNERNAHQQMYAFGCNNNNKLGLLDPDKSLHKSYSGGSPRRRLRKSETDSSPIQSPEPPSPSSLISTPGSVGDDSTADGRSTLSTDVYLPRRVALHCKVIDKKDSPETPTRRNKSAAESIPYGIFSLAASTQHSAALVKRPGGSVELYTWGRGEDGKLGLPVPGADQPLTPTRRWDHLCCGSIDNDDETLNSLIDDSVSPGYDVNNTQSNQSATTPYFVSSPTMVTSLSLLIDSEKTNHPPLPKKNTYLPRSPRKSPKKQSSYTETNSLLLESEHVVKVALGPNCTHVVTSTGRWLVFGSSQDGLLALGGHIHNAYQPVEVKLPLAFGHETMSSISIGETHGIALTSTGKVFTWGVSAGGALGRSNKSYIPIPQPILLPNLLRGHALSSALTRHLRGEASQPSKTKTKSESREGSATDSTPVAYVHAGKDLSVFILRSGSIYTCGKQSGRLGQGDLSIGVSSPTELFGGIQMWRSERP